MVREVYFLLITNQLIFPKKKKIFLKEIVTSLKKILYKFPSSGCAVVEILIENYKDSFEEGLALTQDGTTCVIIYSALCNVHCTVCNANVYNTLQHSALCKATVCTTLCSNGHCTGVLTGNYEVTEITATMCT